MALITANSLTVAGRLKDATLSLQRGETLGLIGPNGAGKSTLLSALGGVQTFTGTVTIEGEPWSSLSPRRRAQRIALQPQSVIPAWSITVEDVVELGRLPWGDMNRQAIQVAMARAGVEEFGKRKIDELSGGERARVWLARVLAGEPDLLLCDEPVASLDIHYQVAVMEVLQAYAQQNHGVIVALHDLSLAARFCDRLCLLSQGEIVALGAPVEVLDEALLSRVYDIPVEVDLGRNPPVVQAR